MVDKEKLKELRERKSSKIKEIQKIVKEQNKIKDAIRNILKDSPKTVPEIADRASLPTDKVMWFVASMKKYGEILEGEKKGEYFEYRLNEEKIEKQDTN